MAKATVDMERGIYEWPDGRRPTRPNGEPVVERKELLRVAGYEPTYHNGGNVLFSDPYYQRQCAYQRAKRDGNLPAVFDEDGIDPERILGLGLLMFTELEKRVTADTTRGPDERPQVSTQQLATFSTNFIKLGLELRTREEEAGKAKSNKLGHLHLNLGDTVVNMNPAERENFLEGQEDRTRQRMEQLRQIIDAQTGREEVMDDPDVIDAEISAESS